MCGVGVCLLLPFRGGVLIKSKQLAFVAVPNGVDPTIIVFCAWPSFVYSYRPQFVAALDLSISMYPILRGPALEFNLCPLRTGDVGQRNHTKTHCK